MDVKVTDHIKEVLEAKEAAIVKFLTEAGLHLASEAQKELENSPRRIDTGNLRGSISTSPVDTSDNSVTVGTNVEYGIYVHEGTRRMEPNRFLKNAFERNAEQVKAKAKEALKGL